MNNEVLGYNGVLGYYLTAIGCVSIGCVIIGFFAVRCVYRWVFKNEIRRKGEQEVWKRIVLSVLVWAFKKKEEPETEIKVSTAIQEPMLAMGDQDRKIDNATSEDRASYSHDASCLVLEPKQETRVEVEAYHPHFTPWPHYKPPTDEEMEKRALAGDDSLEVMVWSKKKIDEWNYKWEAISKNYDVHVKAEFHRLLQR
jgi:hypothetical protein